MPCHYILHCQPSFNRNHRIGQFRIVSIVFQLCAHVSPMGPCPGGINCCIIKGKTETLNLIQKTSIRKSSLKWGLVAAIIPIVCCAVAYTALMFIEYGQWIMPTFTRSIGNYTICFLATVFGCYGEEIGWRGFATQT